MKFLVNIFLNSMKKTKTPIILFFKAIIQTFILKENSNQSFIKSEANLCLESLIIIMKYGDTLITLIQAINSKKK